MLCCISIVNTSPHNNLRYHKYHDTTICKLVLTVNNFTCCFTFETPGLARQLPTKNNEARCKIIGSTKMPATLDSFISPNPEF